MVPKTLEEWNFKSVITLLEHGHFEDERFDFKLALPSPKNPSDKFHFKKSVAAFANAKGGFLIYGIEDDKDLKPIERIKGVLKIEDYPARFGSLLNDLAPRPEYIFKNPPIILESGRVLHIFEVFESLLKPIAVETDGGGFVFPLRTNKGVQEMRYEEIKRDFLSYAHMKDNMLLLVEEFKRIERELDLYQGGLQRVIDNGMIGCSIEHEMVSLCLVNSHGLLKKAPFLIHDLNWIRTAIGLLNGRLKSYYAQISVHGRNEPIRETGISSISSEASSLKNQIQNCLVKLEEFLKTI